MEEASLLQPHLIECLLHSFYKTFGIIDNDSRFFGSHLCFDIVINGLPSLFGMGKHPSIRFFDKSRFDKFKPELENETFQAGSQLKIKQVIYKRHTKISAI